MNYEYGMWQRIEPMVTLGTQPCCKECGVPLEYESMGNGEEWAIYVCAYCMEPLCKKHVIVDDGKFTCCSECFHLEVMQ